MAAVPVPAPPARSGNVCMACGADIVTPTAAVEASRTHEMSSDRTLGGLSRWLQLGSGNPTGAARRGGEMRVTVTAGRARARRRPPRASRSAARIGLGGARASVMMAAGAMVRRFCVFSGVPERHNGSA